MKPHFGEGTSQDLIIADMELQNTSKLNERMDAVSLLRHRKREAYGKVEEVQPHSLSSLRPCRSSALEKHTTGQDLMRERLTPQSF